MQTDIEMQRLAYKNLQRDKRITVKSKTHMTNCT